MARWPLEQQLANVELKIKELQEKKKIILAQIADVEREKEQEAMKELYDTLKARGITPDQYAEVIKNLGSDN